MWKWTGREFVDTNNSLLTLLLKRDIIYIVKELIICLIS
nr:MAG TPA: hypothetical protein [Caudoviricetes sp.]